MLHHLQHISIWDAQRNFMSREVRLVISKEKYMGWYLSVTRRIITPNPEQVPPREEMKYETHARQIQNVVSIFYFL